jgi:hypothetical protein
MIPENRLQTHAAGKRSHGNEQKRFHEHPARAFDC